MRVRERERERERSRLTGKDGHEKSMRGGEINANRLLESVEGTLTAKPLRQW